MSSCRVDNSPFPPPPEGNPPPGGNPPPVLNQQEGNSVVKENCHHTTTTVIVEPNDREKHPLPQAFAGFDSKTLQQQQVGEQSDGSLPSASVPYGGPLVKGSGSVVSTGGGTQSSAAESMRSESATRRGANYEDNGRRLSSSERRRRKSAHLYLALDDRTNELAKKQRAAFHSNPDSGVISVCYEIESELSESTKKHFEAAGGDDTVEQRSVDFNPRSIVLTVGDGLQFQWYSNIGLQEYADEEADATPVTTKTVCMGNVAVQPNESTHHVTLDDPHGLGCAATQGGSHLVHFVQSGTYVFRSFQGGDLRSKDVNEQVVVKVVSAKFKLLRKAASYSAALFVIFVFVSVLIWQTVRVIDENYLFIPTDTSDEAQYQGAREFQDLLLTTAVPWILMSVVLFILLLLARILFFCWRTTMQDYGRGYSLAQHNTTRSVQFFVATVPLLVSMGIFWFYRLTVNYGWTIFFARLTEATLQVLNEVFTILQDVTFLVNELPKLYPIEITPSAYTLLDQIHSIASLIQLYATNGEAIARGLFRILAILIFLSLQLGIVGCGFGIVAIYLSKAKLMRTAVWIMCLSLCLSSITYGVTSFTTVLLERTVELLDSFANSTLTSETLQTSTASGKSAPHVQMFGYCAPDIIDVNFLGTALDGVTDQWNEYTAQFGLENNTLVSQATSMVDVPELLSYTELLGAALQENEATLKGYANSSYITNSSYVPSSTSGTIITTLDAVTELTTRTGPVLKSVISATQSLTQLVNCTILRSMIAVSMPSLKAKVLEPVKVELDLHKAILNFHVVFILVGFICAYVLARPSKSFYDGRTKRWFRFAASFNAHQTITDTQTAAKQKRKVPLNQPLTCFGILSATHSMNLGNATIVALQAVTLTILHFSFPENALTSQLRIVCFLCICAPLISFPTERIDSLGVRIVLRIAASAVLIVAVLFSLNVYQTSLAEAEYCVEMVQQQTVNATNSTQSLWQDECNIDVILRKLELMIYALVIGLVCVLAALTSLVMLGSVRVRSQVNHHLFIESSNVLVRDLRQRKARRFMWLRSLVWIVGSAWLISTVVALTTEDEVTYTPYGATIRLDAQLGCNGNIHICEKKVTDVAWLTSHNAMSTTDTKFFSPSHYYRFETQLQYGVRSFTIEVHPAPGAETNVTAGTTNTTNLQLCHSSCDLGSYPLRNDLAYLRSFLLENRSNAVMLFVETSGVTTAQVVSAFVQADLTGLMWNTSTNSSSAAATSPVTNPNFQWPTVSYLTESRQQVMLFTDSAVDHGATGGGVIGPDPLWVHHVWDFFFENAQASKSVSDFDCSIGRGDSSDPDVLAAKGTILNHYLQNPVEAPYLATQANMPIHIANHYSACQAAWNRTAMNAVLVDFWSLQSPLKTLDDINSG